MQSQRREARQAQKAPTRERRKDPEKPDSKRDAAHNINRRATADKRKAEKCFISEAFYKLICYIYF